MITYISFNCHRIGTDEPQEYHNIVEHLPSTALETSTHDSNIYRRHPTHEDGELLRALATCDPDQGPNWHRPNTGTNCGLGKTINQERSVPVQQRRQKMKKSRYSKERKKKLETRGWREKAPCQRRENEERQLICIDL